MSWVEWLGANIAWILLIAIVVMAVAWMAISRARSRGWGHPTEFAGTMPPAEPLAIEQLELARDRGEISEEEFKRRAQHLATGRPDQPPR